jgi:hypothetical protein
MMARALKSPRPEVGLLQACQDCRKARRHGLLIDDTGSVRRCADGWLTRVRQDFMLEVPLPC